MTDKTDALVARLRMHARDCVSAADMDTDTVLSAAQIDDMADALNEAAAALAEQPAGAVGESVWLFKSGQQWFPFHNEQHRKDTIADGRWDVREFYTNPPAASLEDLRQCADDLDSGIDIRIVSAQLRALIDSAGGAKENEPFGHSEQLRQAAAGFLAASFYPDGDGYTDDMRQTYSYWHKRLLAELRPAGVMEYVQAEASARINARREAASR